MVDDDDNIVSVIFLLCQALFDELCPLDSTEGEWV